MNNEYKEYCTVELCKYKEDCPHAKGIHYNVWGEGISCRQSEDNYEAFKKGESDLPW